MNIREAADALASAVRANKEACFRAREAFERYTSSGLAPWSEEAFQLEAVHATFDAQVRTTHIAVIDALKRYDSVAQIDRLTSAVRSATAHQEPHAGPDLMAEIDAKLRGGEVP